MLGINKWLITSLKLWSRLWEYDQPPTLGIFNHVNVLLRWDHQKLMMIMMGIHRANTSAVPTTPQSWFALCCSPMLLKFYRNENQQIGDEMERPFINNHQPDWFGEVYISRMERLISPLLHKSNHGIVAFMPGTTWWCWISCCRYHPLSSKSQWSLKIIACH